MSLASETCMARGENQLPQISICPSCIHTHAHMISSPYYFYPPRLPLQGVYHALILADPPPWPLTESLVTWGGALTHPPQPLLWAESCAPLSAPDHVAGHS